MTTNDNTTAHPARLTDEQILAIARHHFRAGHDPKAEPAFVAAVRECLAAPAAPAPQGWKLVPVEPTQEMATAYLSLSMKSWRQSYIAMLDAAPAAPAPHANCPAPVDATEAAEREHLGCAHCNTGIYAAPAPAAQVDELPLAREVRATLNLIANSFHNCKGSAATMQELARDCLQRFDAARQQSATPAECTCPSGNGSLRHPCPAHPADAASEAIYLAKLRNGTTTWLEFTAEAWAKLDSTWIRCKADAASEAMSQATRDVLAERQRQISAEGWTPEHDDKFTNGALSLAAGTYALHGPLPTHGNVPLTWPWDHDGWKPSTPRRNLVKAGALILAEIERMDRAAAAEVRA